MGLFLPICTWPTKSIYIYIEFTLIIVGWFLRSTFENSANSPVKSHGMDFWAASSILWQSCSYSTYIEDHFKLLFIGKVKQIVNLII
jgi:hypothetical protein